MTSGNVRRLYVLYWKHSREDRENARSTELYKELIYRDELRIPMRQDLDFRFMNCNRNTESYVIHRDTVEQLRRHKIRYEPLVFIELKERNKDGRLEELWSIDSDYRLRELIKRLDFYFQMEV